MSAAYDGYIRIGTKIDQTGAKSGMAALAKSLKGFAAAVGVAFGVAAVVDFGKACIEVASNLNEVQNVVDTTFCSASEKINAFAQSAATSYGLSELAAKRYSGTMGAMLKSMGFATDQAADMSIQMAALAGDMASFYNLDAEDAFAKIRSGISGETEPLKQLGVNLSEANLSQYALARGVTTSYSALSEQNKALLRYSYLLDVTKDAQGDFSRTSNSWANQVRILSLQFDTLKASLGKAFITVLTPVLRVVNQILSTLNAAATVFGGFIAAVTGQSQTVTTATVAAADDASASMDGLTDSTKAAGNAAEKAGKQASKSLTAFDELNVLSKDSGTDTGGGGSVGGGTGEIAVATAEAGKAAADSVNPLQNKLSEFFGKYQEELARVKSGWLTLKDTILRVWSGLKTQLDQTDIGGAAFRALLNWVYAAEAELNLLIGAVGDLLLAFNIPATVQASLELLGDCYKTIGDIITAVTPGVMAFVDNALAPIAEWLGGKVRDAMSFFGDQLAKIGDWFTAHKDEITEAFMKISETVTAFWTIAQPILDAAWEAFKEVFRAIVDGALEIADKLLPVIGKVSDFLVAFYGWLNAIGVVDAVIAAIQRLKENALSVTGTIVSTIGGLLDTLGGLADFMTGIFTGNWDLAWQGIEEITDGTVATATALFDGLLKIFGIDLDEMSTKAATVWIGIKDTAATTWNDIKNALTGIWTGLKNSAATTWDNIKSTWSSVSGWFKDRVTTPLETTFNGLKTKLGSVWDGIKSTVKVAINTIIDLVNALIRGVNKFHIDIPDWVKDVPLVGKYGGKSIGFNISTIPRLAQGAVIPPNRQFLAVLGDQKRGTNIETPLSTMLQAFKAALSESGYSGAAPAFNITFNGELSALGKVLAPVITIAQNANNKSAGYTLQQV